MPLTSVVTVYVYVYACVCVLYSSIAMPLCETTVIRSPACIVGGGRGRLLAATKLSILKMSHAAERSLETTVQWLIFQQTNDSMECCRQK